MGQRAALLAALPAVLLTLTVDLAQADPADAGAPYSWGGNTFGQLGTTTTGSQRTPTAVPGLPPATTVAEVSAGATHSLALTNTGVVYAWGSDGFGELGDGTTATGRNTARPVSGFPTGTVITHVSAGDQFSLALTSAGTVYAWGHNIAGQLGDGSQNDATRPTPLVGLPTGTTIIAVDAGLDHSLALSSTGVVYGWGWNAEGQLGDGTAPTGAQPVTAARLPPGVLVAQISAGDESSLAISSAGIVYAWGDNAAGQLGDGTTANRSTPAPVTGFPAGTVVSQVSIGYGHNSPECDQSLAVTTTGATYAWGCNNVGQLGNGTTTNTAIPAEVNGIPSISGVTAGYGHSLALSTTGAIYAWGRNNNGELGDGTTVTRSTAVEAMLPAGETFNQISAGGDHSLAVAGSPPTTPPALPEAHRAAFLLIGLLPLAVFVLVRRHRLRTRGTA